MCKARVVSHPQTDPNDADELWAGAAVLQHRVDLLERTERLEGRDRDGHLRFVVVVLVEQRLLVVQLLGQFLVRVRLRIRRRIVSWN